MPDVMTPEQRSHCMSRIRGKNTKPEIALRKALWARGMRYRLRSRLLGRPDIVFPGQHIAIFVDGCFWHGCPEHGVRPKSNSEFWKNKLATNAERDRQVNVRLVEHGWAVLRFWEHEILNDVDEVAERVRGQFRSA